MEKRAWTDERLDDLNGRMERAFDEVKGEVRELRTEMNTRFDSLQRSFDSIHRILVIGVISMSATIVGALFVVQS